MLQGSHPKIVIAVKHDGDTITSLKTSKETAGWITPGDLWVASNGDVHVLWTERALDERLRETFFPDAKQRHGLYYAVVRKGQIIARREILVSEEGSSNPVPGRGRGRHPQ